MQNSLTTQEKYKIISDSISYCKRHRMCSHYGVDDYLGCDKEPPPGHYCPWLILKSQHREQSRLIYKCPWGISKRGAALQGKVTRGGVITEAIQHFKKREWLEEVIEAYGSNGFIDPLYVDMIKALK